MRSVRLIDLGRRSYKDVWQLQLDLVARRSQDQIPDTLLIVEHPHVYTKGRKSQDQRATIRVGDLMVPCYEIERGGDITYHGPGQLVAYPILGLQHYDRDLYLYLRNLEEVLIRTCSDCGVLSRRISGLTGVWTDEKTPRKIASIGVAMKRWVTYHGLALNVKTDLRFFHAINPCGLDAALMTSLEQVLAPSVNVELKKVPSLLIRHFSAVFERCPENISEYEMKKLYAANVTNIL
jgi:lipoyl(octanoyl) transferase